MTSAVETEKNREIIRRFAQEFVNESDYGTAEEFLAEDVVDHTPLGETTGRDAVVATTKELRSAFPDFAVTPEAVVADGDTVAVRMTQQGTHEGAFMGNEPAGNSFEIEAMAFLGLKDGRIVERRVRPDLLGLLRQLGIGELSDAQS